MSDLRPFAAIRPRPDRVADVAAPPYDVLDRERIHQILQQHPDSFVRVTRPDAEFSAETDRLDGRIFDRGLGNLRDLMAREVLIREAEPAFYLLELTMGSHRQVGVFACASLLEYERGLIKRHEKTVVAAEGERTRHLDVLGHNTGVLFFTYRARAEIDELVHGICRRGDPVYDFVADDDIGHRLWVVPASSDGARRLQQRFAKVPALYVADGHHRTAAAAHIREVRQQANASHRGDEAYNYAMAAVFPHDQLQILAYNRVVLDLGGHGVDELKRGIARSFEVQPIEGGTVEPDRPRCFGMFIDGHWYRLTARPGSFPADDVVRSLDTAILQDNVLSSLFGIDDPRRDPRVEFVGGIEGPGALERKARAAGGVAFALHPTSIEQVMAIADAGADMPPKSTWFEPKLRSGIVARSLEGKVSSAT
jgi:uncharacterized protein (DUF1015 family)